MTAPASPHTHVCLISAQPMANLLPLLLEKPAEAVFLATAEMAEQAAWLERVVRPRGIGVRRVAIPAYDLQAIITACEQLVIEGCDRSQLTLNVTGGTKVAALAAFMAFYSAGCRIIYLNTGGNAVEQLAPSQERIPLAGNLVQVREYLAAYGKEMLTDGGPPAGFAGRRRHLPELARFFSERGNLLRRFNGLIERHRSGEQYANLPLNELGGDGDALAALLEDCGVACRTGAAALNIPNREKVIFCRGGWLEELVYDRIAALGLAGVKPRMNVEFRWQEKGGADTTNELDVLFTHANRLHVVSCKAADLGGGDQAKGMGALYELHSLADRTAGLFGESMLVSAQPLRQVDLDRASRMRIEVVAGRDLTRLDERLRAWSTRGQIPPAPSSPTN